MKGKKQEILRIENILNSDKMNPDDKFKKILMMDLRKLLSDYFELSFSPEIKVVKQGGKYSVDIFFISDSIKNFKYIKD